MRLENMRSSILCAVLLLCGVTFAQPVERNDVIQVVSQKRSFELSWSDTEDAIKGVVSPDVLREGEPVRVSVTVGSFYGEAFDGPVTLALRPQGSHGQTESFTVKPESGTWRATFTPREAGTHVLDVSFRTTRHKLLHAKLIVDQARLPRAYAWVLGGALMAIAILTGVFWLLRKPPSRPLPEADAPVGPPPAP